MKKANVLIIGGGMITQEVILPTIFQERRKGKIEKVFVATRRKITIEKLRELFPEEEFKGFPEKAKDPGEPFPECYKEALSQLPKPGIVIVATPDHLHTQMTIDSLRNGFHVIVEKPLCLKVKEVYEIDKVAKRAESGGGADVSREGVQRDLLPLVEGCTVSTKYGMVKTDHILFIASGAFHLTKPSDLIPELQGRLPIRVELTALNADDFERILTEPDAALTVQYEALMKTEGLSIEFTKDGVKQIAQSAFHVNETAENIGARRLHTIRERLLEDISFSAPDKSGQSVTIDAEYVNSRLTELVNDEDLSRYIL